MCIKPDQARSPHMGANPAKAMTDRVKSLIELFLQFLKCLNNPYILSYDLFHLFELINVSKIFADFQVDIQI